MKHDHKTVVWETSAQLLERHRAKRWDSNEMKISQWDLFFKKS